LKFLCKLNIARRICGKSALDIDSSADASDNKAVSGKIHAASAVIMALETDLPQMRPQVTSSCIHEIICFTWRQLPGQGCLP